MILLVFNLIYIESELYRIANKNLANVLGLCTNNTKTRFFTSKIITRKK